MRERRDGIALEGGHEDDRGPPLDRQPLEQRQAVRAGEVHVEQHEVGREGLDGRPRRRRVAAGAHHLYVGLVTQQAAQAPHGERLVLHQQRPDRHATRSARNGSDTRTTSPAVAPSMSSKRCVSP